MGSFSTYRTIHRQHSLFIKHTTLWFYNMFSLLSPILPTQLVNKFAFCEILSNLAAVTIILILHFIYKKLKLVNTISKLFWITPSFSCWRHRPSISFLFYTALTKHASILSHMFSIAENNGITVLLYDPNQVQNPAMNNEVYLFIIVWKYSKVANNIFVIFRKDHHC